MVYEVTAIISFYLNERFNNFKDISPGNYKGQRNANALLCPLLKFVSKPGSK
jgi:hypothetical protein